MFSRRVFIQGTTVVFGSLLPGFTALRAEAGSDPVTAIDSTETPFFSAAANQRHIRLSGSQLQRFNTLMALFDQSSDMTLHVHLDDTGRLLVETALNATGKRITRDDPAGGALSFVSGKS